MALFRGIPIGSGSVLGSVAGKTPQLRRGVAKTMPIQSRVSTPGGVSAASSNNGVGRMLRARAAKKTRFGY